MRKRDFYLNQTNQPTGGKNTYQPSASGHHSFARRSAQPDGSGKRLLLMLGLLLVLARVGVDALQRHETAMAQQNMPQTDAINTAPEPTDSVELIAGGVIIKADATGHFRGKVLIDAVEMPFLIDTGATQTAIPQDLARQANLPIGKVIQTNTAGGQVNNQLTRMSSMQLGNAELKNLQAIINPHLTEVLIGMNTLKYFRMTQLKDTLTLVVSNEVEPVDTQERDLPLQMPPPAFMAEVPDQATSDSTATEFSRPATQWKKSMDCAPGRHCAPSYSAK